MGNRIGFYTLAKREILRFMKVPQQTLLAPFITSLIFIFIFGSFLGSRIEQMQGISYMEFVIPGIIMMQVITNGFMNTSASIFISRFQNHIQEILVAPLSYFEMVSAYLIGGVARSVMVAVLIYLVSIPFIGVQLAHPLILLYFLLATSLIFSCVGVLVSLWAENFDQLSIPSTFVITPLTFFGGVFHSIHILPPFAKAISVFNPFFYMIDGFRYGMVGVKETSLGLSLAVVTILAAGLYIWTVQLFKSGWKLRT